MVADDYGAPKAAPNPITIPIDVQKAIEIATESKIRAITFDAEIVNDKLKYSNWLTTMAIGLGSGPIDLSVAI